MQFSSILIDPEYNTAESRDYSLFYVRCLILHIWRTRSENPIFLFEIEDV